MTNNEINKIIAEYMGYLPCKSETCGVYGICENCKTHPSRLYTNCLDNLVPVWEKLKFWEFRLHGKSGYIEVPSFKTHVSSIVGETDKMKTIQEAAAHATAKAIQELSK